MSVEVASTAGDAAPRPLCATGNAGHVLRAARDGTGTLALVLETEGSTYARAGAMAWFDQDRQVGWLSGGCLEPELARQAALADASGRLHWLEIDTRADEAMLSGSAIGCRGRLRILLLPLRAMPGVAQAFDAWLDGGATLERRVREDGDVAFAIAGDERRWRLPMASAAWANAQGEWTLPLPRAPEVLLFGAGPETPTLLRVLHDLGWRTTLVERRPRWRAPDAPCDVQIDDAPSNALTQPSRYDAALVMHHDFERDRDALEALSATPVPFVGLLGPPRRRDDLFKLLTPWQRQALARRLHAPVGLPLGGEGPEAIALSIAAQLQAWRTGAAMV